MRIFSISNYQIEDEEFYDHVSLSSTSSMDEPKDSEDINKYEVEEPEENEEDMCCLGSILEEDSKAGASFRSTTTMEGFKEEDEEMGGCSPCSAQQERRIVEKLTQIAESNRKLGDVFCVLATRWYTEWQNYTKGVLDDRPGEIDNSHVCVKSATEDHLDIIKYMQKGRNYDLVPLEVWNKLYHWYKGGPELRLIYVGCTKEFETESQTFRLQLLGVRNKEEVVMNKKTIVRELYDNICTLLGLAQREVHIWDCMSEVKQKLLNVCDQNLKDNELVMALNIYVEIQQDRIWIPDSDGNDSNGNPLPSDSRINTTSNDLALYNNPTGYTFNMWGPSNAQEDERYNPLIVAKGARKGLKGLRNLGNTCYMNSAIQCLVHTPALVEYFLNDYIAEIDEDNPIGMQGVLATAFGNLVNKLWAPEGRTIAPRRFMRKLDICTEQFHGFNQHDSHEFLAFLLDGLHEDLNCVKKRLYVELKDANSRPDEEVANEYWENHKAREDSVIVDFFHGQYKSKLVCPVCSKESIKFEPFTCLQLPLPIPVTREMTVTVVCGDGSAHPHPYTVTVLRRGCIKNLIGKLSNECCLRFNESLLLAEVLIYCKETQYLDPDVPLSYIKDHDCLVAYRLPKEQEGFIRLEITHRTRRYRASLNNYVLENPMTWNFQRSKNDDQVAPIVTCIAYPKDNTEIITAAHMTLKPFLKSKSDNEEDVWVSERYIGKPMNKHCDKTLPEDQSMDYEELPYVDAHEHYFPTWRQISATVEWSERESNSYDFSALKHLPRVHVSDDATEEKISFYSCLEEFLKEEPLGNDDMWYCSNCKEHRPATKKLDLWRLPEIFVVQLKRFSSDENGYPRKITSFVNFPVQDLDLSKYTKSKNSAQSHVVYKLYAIINHWGSLTSGHYTAFVKVEEHDKWYHFDDNSVSHVEEDKIQTTEAYVLFYRKVVVE